MTLWEMTLKLVVAAVVGGAIGFEREAHERPAGLRTHILVCMGAALFALASFQIAGQRFDPGRITAQIVTGIGFLGAGTIMHRGSIVRGLTTAASIWTVAAIGIAVAIGGKMMCLAVIATALVIGTLTVAKTVEKLLISRPNERGLTFTIRGGGSALGYVLAALDAHHASIKSVASEEGPESGLRVVSARVIEGRGFDQTAVDAELATCEDVISYNWD